MKRALISLLLAGAVYGQTPLPSPSTTSIGNFPFDFQSPSTTVAQVLVWDPLSSVRPAVRLATMSGLTYNTSTNTLTAGAGGGIAGDTFWAAKGDLAVGTLNDTAAVLSVGTANQVLTVDSSTATGLKWATPATSGTGTLTATGLSLPSNAVVLGNTYPDTKVDAGVTVTSTSGFRGLNLGTSAGGNVGYISLHNASSPSGPTVLQPASGAIASQATLTLPNITTTLVGIDTTDVLTNKTVKQTFKLRNTGNWDTTLNPSSDSAAYTVTFPSATTTLLGTTAAPLTSNSVVLGAGTTDTKVVAGITTNGTAKLTLGQASTSTGQIDFKNGTGTTTLQPLASSGTVTISLPATTGTVALAGDLPTFPTGAIVGTTDTQTLTSKTLTGSVVQPRVTTSSTSNTTPTPNADTDDVYSAVNMTVNMAFGAPTGATPFSSQKLIIRISGTAARTLSFAQGSSGNYRFSTDIPVPTTTTTTKTMYLGFIWNGGDSRWDCVAKTDGF